MPRMIMFDFESNDSPFATALTPSVVLWVRMISSGWHFTKFHWTLFNR